MRQQKEFFKRQEVKEKRETSSVKLPKLDMCSFNGNKLKWSEFWDTFECTVYRNRNLSNIEKFSYLLNKLFGEAKGAISGLALSHENYEVAVDILKERFGNKQEVVDQHYKEFMNIPSASNKVYSLRAFLDATERHLRSLEVLEENINQHVFVSMIRSTLPEDILRQLEFNKGTKTEWILYALRHQIREYVTACEKAEKKSDEYKEGAKNRNVPDKKMSSSASRFKQQNHYQQRNPSFQSRIPISRLSSSTEYLMASTKISFNPSITQTSGMSVRRTRR
ncbi:uncharacterized protein LOC128223365 [Mya arenaria]|uniref:uncharacterized protein LOC128223365 n=1 Tax=Mya arenaria TaxID=6604 RepID=UPI0022E04EE3|nr:uncharacterized protein LOC128223365 [Mya arenaria]